MSTMITGVVTNGVVVPHSPLPEGIRVEIYVPGAMRDVAAGITPTELRKLARDQRQAVLAVAAALAEDDYRHDKELTGFNAFSEEADDSEQG